MRGICSILLIISLTACTYYPKISDCPKCPHIPLLKCGKLKKVDFIEKDNYILFDKENSNKLLYNIKLMKKCIAKYKEIIEKYNNLIKE